MKIAFIGLGNMGAPMAANLAGAGHDVVGADPMATPEGLTMAASAAEACAGADIAVTMLPNGEILRGVASEIIGALPKGSHDIRVTLNTNDHRPYMGPDGPVMATTVIVVD